MTKITNLSELQFYVNLLEDLNEKKYSDYELLEKDLLIELGIRVDRQKLNELFEPTVEEEERELSIMWRNIYE